MAIEVSWHLERLGHPADPVGLRARVLVPAVAADIHEIDPNGRADDLIDELIRLCVRSAAAERSADRGG